MIARRGLFGTLASAGAAAKMAMKDMTAAGASIGAGVNMCGSALRGAHAPQVEIDPVWNMIHQHPLAESFRKADHFRDAMAGFDGPAPCDPSVLAIKSYSPWYAKMKMYEIREAREHWTSRLAKVLGVKLPNGWSK